MTLRFKAELEIIGINPFVPVPEDILAALFESAGRAKGPIPVKGSVNGRAFRQTLVRYLGAWRLYINMVMLPDSPRRVGEWIEVTIAFDEADRSIPVPPEFEAALDADPEAAAVFNNLTPSRRKEIVRYIANLKSPDAVSRNVARATAFLKGQGRFIGRDTP